MGWKGQVRISWLDWMSFCGSECFYSPYTRECLHSFVPEEEQTRWAWSWRNSLPQQSHSLETQMELKSTQRNTCTQATSLSEPIFDFTSIIIPSLFPSIFPLWNRGSQQRAERGGETQEGNWSTLFLIHLPSYAQLVQCFKGLSVGYCCKQEEEWMRSVLIPDSAVSALTVWLHGPGPIELNACIWTWYWVQGFRSSNVTSLVSPPPSTSLVLFFPWPSVRHTCSR